MRRRASRSAGVYSRISIEVLGRLRGLHAAGEAAQRKALRASRYVRAKALTFHQRAWRFAPSYFRGAPFGFAQGKEALRFHRALPVRRHSERSGPRIWFARSAGTRSRRTSLRFEPWQHFQSKRGPSTTLRAREKRG